MMITAAIKLNMRSCIPQPSLAEAELFTQWPVILDHIIADVLLGAKESCPFMAHDLTVENCPWERE